MYLKDITYLYVKGRFRTIISGLSKFNSQLKNKNNNRPVAGMRRTEALALLERKIEY